jgi:hypothetical protein
MNCTFCDFNAIKVVSGCALCDKKECEDKLTAARSRLKIPYWIAIYDDGTSLRQFEDSFPGNEHKYDEINQDKLKEFAFFKDGNVISVFPKTGHYGINGVIFTYEKLQYEKKLEVIYFARRQVQIGSGPATTALELLTKFSIYNIGLKNLGEANKKESNQLIVKIDDNNRISIETK